MRKVINAVILGLLLLIQRSRADVVSGAGIAAYGDSLSWQYSLWVPFASSFGYSIFSNGQQFNWVDHLVMSGYNFGPLVDVTGNGNYYNAYDVAIGGNVSGDLPAQVSNLEPYLAAKEIRVAVLEIGGNNFTAGVGNKYPVIYNRAANASYDPLADPDVQNFIDALVADIANAIDASLAVDPDLHMILTTVPDLGDTPAYRTTYSNASRRADVTAVVGEVNRRILELASLHRFPVVDLAAIGAMAVSPPMLAGVQLLAGGSNSGRSMYLSDRFHPGTVANGLLANAYLYANHLAYGDAYLPISDQTILMRAGVTPTILGPTYFDVTPFVIYTPIPEASTSAMLATAGLCCVVIKRWRTRRAH